MDETSPTSKQQEAIMNSVNANTTINGTLITADVENEVKKKVSVLNGYKIWI